MRTHSSVRSSGAFLSRCLGGFGLALLVVGCGAGSGPTSGELIVYTNAGDSVLVAGSSPGGAALFGERDEDGLPIALTEASFGFQAGDPTRKAKVFFDADERLERITLDGGGVASLEYVATDRVVVTVKSANRRESGQLGIDLPQASAQATSSQAFVGPSQTSIIGTVESRCGATTPINGEVDGSYTTDKEPGTSVPIAFTSLGTGHWQYSLPGKSLVASATEQLDWVRRKVNQLCGQKSEVARVIAAVTKDELCNKLQALGVSAAVLQACRPLLDQAAPMMCPTLKALLEQVPKPNDSLANTYNLTITVRWPESGEPPGTFNLSVNAADASIPTQVYDRGSDTPMVGDIVVVPADPKPKEGYTVTVNPMCFKEGTKLRISVEGTDGYRQTRDFTLTGSSPSASTFVPGGAQSVQDKITVTFPDSPVTITENYKYVVF